MWSCLFLIDADWCWLFPIYVYAFLLILIHSNWSPLRVFIRLHTFANMYHHDTRASELPRSASGHFLRLIQDPKLILVDAERCSYRLVDSMWSWLFLLDADLCWLISIYVYAFLLIYWLIPVDPVCVYSSDCVLIFANMYHLNMRAGELPQSVSSHC